LQKDVFWLAPDCFAISVLSVDMTNTYGVLAWLLLLLCRLKTGVLAADCDTTGDDLIIDADTECSLSAAVSKTFGRISIAGRVLISKDTPGLHATLRADTEVVIASTGILTATGQGYDGGQGPGHGVTRNTWGSGGKSLVTTHRSSI